MHTESELKALALKVLDFAEECDAEALVSSGDNALTRYGDNVITQNVANSGVGLSLRVIRDGKMGKASTGNMSDEGLKHCAETALMAWKVAMPDDTLQPLLSPQTYQTKESYFEDAHRLSPEAKADGVARGIAACRERGLTAAGIYSNSGGSFGIANSKGLWAFHRSSNATFSISAMSETSSGWAEDTDPCAAKVDAQTVIDTAIKVALDGQNPVSIEPGKYTVIFEPTAVAEFLLFLGWEALNGLAFVENRSCFSGKAGQKILGENITLTDDFLHPLTPGQPFDFEGAPRQKVVMVEKGVFKQPVHDRKTGALAGMASTGHAMPQPDTYGPSPLNVVMSPGDSSVEQMIASTRYGLLVRKLHYTNILNPMTMMLTGMTRDGFFLIEDGKVTKGLKNMRFTDSALRVLSNVEALSKQLFKTETFWGGGGTVAPVIKVNDFHFTSNTEN